jgi:hypothetical protein
VAQRGAGLQALAKFASEETNFERNVIEACLSRTISDELEAADCRHDFRRSAPV